MLPIKCKDAAIKIKVISSILIFITTSPIPSTILTAINNGKLVRAAMGVSRVSNEVHRTPQPNNSFPPNLNKQSLNLINYSDKGSKRTQYKIKIYNLHIFLQYFEFYQASWKFIAYLTSNHFIHYWHQTL